MNLILNRSEVFNILLSSHIKIIDSGEAVARQTKAVLDKNNLSNTSYQTGEALFYVNSNPQVLKTILGFEDNVFEKDF